MADADLEELVQLAQQGDKPALHELLGRSEPAMQRLAGRVCPPADAEDAVQEVLYRVSEQVGALRVSAAFVGWSMKMLVRECLRFKRRAWRFVFQERDGAVAPTADFHDMAGALEQLSDKSREILLHRDILERTAPETAEQLGISVESAKSRLRRARAEIRELLTEEQ